MRTGYGRFFDCMLALCCMLAFAPLMACIAVFIKLQDRGPVLFIQERAGKHGRPFKLLKFRSMKAGADPFAQSPSAGNDPRLIRGGDFLRRYSLDELPQLLNVLFGDMSMIGPRPLYVSQVNALSEYHRRRLLVLPGITGLSQVYLRSELTSHESLDMECAYVEKKSFLLDVKIFFLTIGVVLGKKGVYETTTGGRQ